MGGSKQTTNTSYSGTNTYGQISPLDDPRYASAVGDVKNFQFTANPRIPYAFAQARTGIHESLNNPMGGYTTQNIRDATERSAYQNLAQQESEATSEDYANRQGQIIGQKLAVAQMSAPHTVQTGQSGSQSGTQTMQQSPFDTIVGGASDIGSALLL